MAETDLASRPKDASRRTVVILTAVLGSILVVGAFAMIYLLYRRINETGNSRAVGEGGQPLEEPISFARKSDRPPRQDGQREHRDNWGMPSSTQNGLENPKPPRPAHLRREKDRRGDMTSGGTRVRDERLSMDETGTAR
ncbi:hypothetical protein FQN54_005127 [Arachnomyces sp. PD_36]|nr:hypothetical protein FQN54_005127 [Arachnomyces sp. PD_36]